MGSHPSSPYEVPALVLGGPSHTTLSVVRALGLAHIPQFAVGTRGSFVAGSRWHRRLRAGDGDPTPETLPEWLAALALDPMVLVPCSDDWVAAVASLPADLAVRFPASLPDREGAETCLDKGRFAALLAHLGVPHPRTLCVEASDDVEALGKRLRDPFVKPRNSLQFRARYGVKAIRLGNAAVDTERIRAAQRAGVELMLQEFIPGPAPAHHYVDGFVDRHGVVKTRVGRRRLRTYPEPFGDSSAMMTIPLDDVREPVAVLERLLPVMRYRGVFSAEFKHDARDGQFKLIEINPRAWGGLGLPVACGINVIEMAYRDALGLDIPASDTYPVGRRWVYGIRDAAAGWPLVRRRELTAREWAWSWLGAVQPVMRWNDPLPGAIEILRALHLAWAEPPRGRVEDRAQAQLPTSSR